MAAARQREFAESVTTWRNNFRTFLNGLLPRNARHFSHPALNCRYGIELEFLSSSNRYVVANRVNSCIWSQNDEWWGKNFDALADIDPNLPGDGRNLKETPNNFDEWSSFFIGVSEEYRAPSFKGYPDCARRGNAGPRIESDGSVTLDNDGPGVTLWSKQKGNNYANTDVKIYDAARDTWRYDLNYRGLNDRVVLPNFSQPSEVCSQHSLYEGERWDQQMGSENKLFVWNNNELVTNVLTNEHINYPFVNRGGEEYADGIVPLGGLLLDNLCNHLLSHRTVLMTQRMGFHVHLSEYPKIQDFEERRMFIIGFVKLFYIFEPLLYAFHPHYRSESDYCQSIQSIFTLSEIRNSSYQAIWDDLVNGASIGGVNRKIRGMRYLSLNLQNCIPNGIGTIEVRLGHSTFDSAYIQAYIHILQSLLMFNYSLLNYDMNNRRDLYASHNYLLTNSPIPAYCNQPSDNYNAFVYKVEDPRGRPTLGFFTSHRGDIATPTGIIQRLLQLLQGLTGCTRALEILVPYINEYHNQSAKFNWLTLASIGFINHEALMRAANNSYGMGNVQFPAAPHNFNDMYVVGEGMYAIDNANRYDLTHKCRTCSVDRDNVCKPDFNDGNYPVELQNERANVNDLRNEANVYSLYCGHRNTASKTQTELINYKLTRGVFAGGTKRTVGGQELLNNTMTEEPLKKVRHTEYAKYFRVNRGAEPIVLQEENNGSFTVGYTNWMGGFTPEQGLTTIVKVLLENKIIDRKTLDLLLKNRYLDYYVFLNADELHQKKLIEELGNLGITPEVIENIRKVYAEHSPRPEPHPVEPAPESLGQPAIAVGGVRRTIRRRISKSKKRRTQRRLL